MEKKQSREHKVDQSDAAFRLPSRQEGKEPDMPEPPAPRERMGNERKATLNHVADDDSH